MIKYSDPKRKVGNQQEVPKIINKDELLNYGGYQEFTLHKNKIDNLKGYLPIKTKIIQPYLNKFVTNDNFSLIDIGCSNGAIGFFAYHMGINKINLYDHDLEYIKNVQHGIDFLGASDKIKAYALDIQDIDCKADLVTMFAVIHWVYSCTSCFGSIDRIIQFLSTLTNNHLIIEWVSPKDIAIQEFKHIDFNKSVHQDLYNESKFIEALHKHFPYVNKIGKVKATREIWIASRTILDRQLSSRYTQINAGTSIVYIDPTHTYVIKIFKDLYLQNGIFERELYWLKKMSDYDRVPNLYNYDSDEKYIIMEYKGSRLNNLNIPTDFKQQCSTIVSKLKEYNCQPWDIKLDEEVLIQNGQVNICDFGWCPLIVNQDNNKVKLDYTLGGIVNDIDPIVFTHFSRKPNITDV